MLHALSQFAVTYSYSYSDTNTQSSTGSVFLNIVLLLIGLALVVLMVASMWRLFIKAGKPGWAAFVPFYNTYVLLQITGKPGWWLLLFFIPIVNFFVSVVVYYELVKCFGKGVGFLILLVVVPMVAYPLLAFGDAEYHAPTPEDGTEPEPPYPTKKGPNATPPNPVS
jgi:uncharacterized membrane protein YhaH (DUF805 family)